MKAMVVRCAAAFILATGGCSAFRSSTQILTINTSVPDAIISVNGASVGRSPLSTPVRRNRDVTIQAYKDGYVPVGRVIGNHFNGTGALDAVGCVFWLLPGIGLLSSGAWSLDETNIMLQLYPIGNPAAMPAPLLVPGQ